MRLSKLVLLGGAALAATACSDDDGITDSGPPPAQALVRFVNAAADTGAVSLVFVDKVENLPTMQGVAFRASSGVYQRVDPGSRMVKVFLATSSDVVNTTTTFVDTTLTLAANTRYTLVYAGNARGNADRLAVIEEPLELPTPAAGTIAVKVLHAAVGTGNVDLFVGPSGPIVSNNPTNGDPVVNQVGKIAGVSYLTFSPYATLPIRTGTAAPLYTFGIAAAGGATADFLSTPNQAGAASTTPTVGPLPGVQIEGSVLTAVVMPGGVAGSPAGGANGTNPSVVLLIDKQIIP